MNTVFKPFVPFAEMSSVTYNLRHNSSVEHQSSIVDDLLFEIYDRWYDGRHDSFESDTFTECSSTSEVCHWRRNSVLHEIDNKHSGWLHQGILETQSVQQLRKMVPELQHRINYMSSRLVRQLKRRDRRWAKLQHNCDLVTAILQASSQKRRVDTRIRFSLEPPPGDSAFEQWKDAMKAVARLPLGIPDSFRRKVWLSLADNHIKELRIDWSKTVRFAFNERSNPDDNTLGMQIVKDLHRTGCSGFSGHDNDEDRAILKRVLLGYARWNKTVGYCQGFNVIAALLLEVMEKKEDDALKVMIYLIDHVLPDSYYANNLRSLSVDMAVFRDLLRLMFPKLSKHLDYLQHAAQDNTTGASYEPPLTNVFTMQWFLTMFATCLPKDLVLRVWDSILLEGSEILLRTALAIWGKLAKRIMSVSSADEFYSLMGTLTQEMMEGKIFHADSLVKFIYACAPFPMPQLPELREKYTYNIRPFSGTASGNKKSSLIGGMLPSDEDDLDEEDLEAITCFTGIIPSQIGSGKSKGQDGDGTSSSADISMVGPGAYGMGTDSPASANTSVVMERMCTDISSLKKQYRRLKQRQTQAHIIIAAASAKQQTKVKAIVPKIETPKAMNHLFVGKQTNVPNTYVKNRFVTASPRIAQTFPKITMVPRFLQNGSKKLSPIKQVKNNSVNEKKVTFSENQAEDISANKDNELPASHYQLNDFTTDLNTGNDQIEEPVAESQRCSEESDDNQSDERLTQKCSVPENGNENAESAHACDENKILKSNHLQNEDGVPENVNQNEVLETGLHTQGLGKDEIDLVKITGNDMECDSPVAEETDINADKISSVERAENTEVGRYGFQNFEMSENIVVESDSHNNSETENIGDVVTENVDVDSDSFNGVKIPENTVGDSLNLNSPIKHTDKTENITDKVESLKSMNMAENALVTEENVENSEMSVSSVSTVGDVSIQDGEIGVSSVVCENTDKNNIFDGFSPSMTESSHEVINDKSECFDDQPSENLQEKNYEREAMDRTSSVDTQNMSEDPAITMVPTDDAPSLLPKEDEIIDNYEGSEKCAITFDVSSNNDELKNAKNSHKFTDSVTDTSVPPENVSPSHHKENGVCVLTSNQNSNALIKDSVKENVEYSTPRSARSTSNLDLAKYLESKRSVSRSCSQESESSKHFTDSDASVTSPESEKRVTWSPDLKTYHHAKHTANKKPFNPFPVKHFNENRAKTGIKLGLYKSSMFEQMEKQTKRKPLWSK